MFTVREKLVNLLVPGVEEEAIRTKMTAGKFQMTKSLCLESMYGLCGLI